MKTEHNSPPYDLILSYQAERDLADIWAYIAQDNIEAADKLLLRIETQFENLAHHPFIGKSIPQQDSEFRFLPIDRYIVIYQTGLPENNKILIIRVLNSALDYTRILN